MAISKQATNIYIQVTSAYKLRVEGSVQKLANKVNIEAFGGNLTLASNKKVVGQGGKESADG